MHQITQQNDRLVVPNNPIIPFIEGDGIGKEITASVRRIIDKAVEKAYDESRKIDWLEVLAGEKAYNKVGSWLPAETMDAFRKYLVGIKGPLTTPVGEGIRSLNVALRQELDLYVCLRPVRWFKGVATPLLHPEKVHVTIFRENTEDIYAGIEWNAGTPEVEKVLKFLKEEMGVAKIRFPETTSIGVKPVSVEGTERLVRSAIEYAIKNKLPSVTLVHKGNIMKFTEGGFKKWGYALAEREFRDEVFTENIFNKIKAERGLEAAVAAYNEAIENGKVFIKDVIADAFLQNTLLKPEVPALARKFKAEGLGSVVVAEENYGEGSSREHAAMEPRHLNVKVILVKSFARIHETNLKKQGMLALTFVDKEDYSKVQERDKISIIGLTDFTPGKNLKVVLHHLDGSTDEFEAAHTYNEQQIGWFKAGSALNGMR